MSVEELHLPESIDINFRFAKRSLEYENLVSLAKTSIMRIMLLDMEYQLFDKKQAAYFFGVEISDIDNLLDGKIQSFDLEKLCRMVAHALDVVRKVFKGE